MKYISTQLDLLERDWLTRMIPVVLDRMRGRDFTADDIHGIVEPPSHLNWYGVLFSKLRPHLERVGYATSKRPERNGGLIRTWRVK